MSEISKGALTSENNNSFPNNNTGYITPTILRTFNQNMIDSLVDEISYTADSASVSASISQLQGFSSSLDATFATDAQLTALSTSVAVTDNGQDSKLTSLINATSSYVTESETSSFARTNQSNIFSGNQYFLNDVYVDSNRILFTNRIQDNAGGIIYFYGDLTAFNPASHTVNANLIGTASFATTASFALNATGVDTGSLVTTSSFNSYTQSASTNVSGAINTATGSSLVTASFSSQTLTFTKGDGSQFSLAIPDVSGSTIDTGSFATTGSNNFIGDQKITGSVRVDGDFFLDDDGGTTSFLMNAKFNTEFLGSQWRWFESAKKFAWDVFEEIVDINLAAYGTGYDNGLSINLRSDGTTFSDYNTSYVTQSWLRIPVNGNTNPAPQFPRGATTTGSLSARSGSIYSISNNTTLNPQLYYTASEAGFANIVRGFDDDLDASGNGSNQANFTARPRVTGSNNILTAVQVIATTYPGNTADMTGYISGSGNIILSGRGGMYLNSGSQLLPKTTANQIGLNGRIMMNFTTSSLSGGHPVVNQNILQGGSIVLNHPSGSVNAVGNLLLGAAITSSQGFTTNVRPTLTANIGLQNTATLRHISSSITYNNNFANSNIVIENHLSSSGISNNGFNFTNNAVLGGTSNTGHNIYVSGSQNSNATRNIIDNIIGGKNIIVSSSFVSSSNSNLLASLIYGQNLIVSGNHGTNGGSTFVGRFNDTGSLSLAQDIVFAVGTGTSTTARRTGLWIDSGSNATVSGSLTSIGNLTIASGSGDFYIYGHKMFNSGEFWSTTTQSGSAGVSGSITFNNSGSVNGVSLANNSQLTVANAGTYNIQFSAQIETSAGADTAYVWFKKNGTNISDSATKVVLANNTAQVMTVNILDEAAANDYYELGYQFTNGNATILSEAASGNIPAIPSVIATITQAR